MIHPICKCNFVLKDLEIPRGFSVRPILIHVNGVDVAVTNSGFFARVIDFSEFLK